MLEETKRKYRIDLAALLFEQHKAEFLMGLRILWPRCKYKANVLDLHVLCVLYPNPLRHWDYLQDHRHDHWDRHMPDQALSQPSEVSLLLRLDYFLNGSSLAAKWHFGFCLYQ